MGAIGRTLTCPECGNVFVRGGKFCAHCGTLLSRYEVDFVDPEGPVGVLPSGTLIGSYRLLAMLGEGGMGRVYVAEHVKLGRRVAIKKLRPELVSNATAVARFFAEARAVNRISHDNIVEITDLIEQPGGDNCIIMELLRGEDLAHLLLRKQMLPLPRAFAIAAQTASALAAVHAAGMIHRDLKPDNIFLIDRGGTPDFVKVLDFGVAKLTDPDGSGIAMHTTAKGQIIGTPEYMSPEQAAGKPVDYRTDVYALGVIIYEMITGALPFQGKSFGDLMIKHMTAPVVIPALSPGLPYGIQSGRDQLLLDLLAKDPADRPRSMTEVELRLRELIDAMELPPPPRPRAAISARTEAAQPAAASKSSEQFKTAERVAKVALVKRPTPQIAVEIATPRSSSRIEFLTPQANRVEPVSAPPVAPVEEPAPAAPPVTARLARASTDRAVSASSAEPADLPRFAAGRLRSSDGLEPLERSQSGRIRRPPLAGSSPTIAQRDDPAEHPTLDTRRATGPTQAVAGPWSTIEAVAAESALIEAAAMAPRSTAGRISALPESIATHPPRPARWRRLIVVAAVLGVMVVAAAAGVALRREHAAAPAAQASPPEVKIKFVSAPPGATVRRLDTGDTLGATPFTRSFARSDRSVTFEIAMSGFATVTQDIALVADDAFATALTPLPPEPPSAPPGSADAPPPAVPPPPGPTVIQKRDRPHVTAPTKPKPERTPDRNGTLDVFQQRK